MRIVMFFAMCVEVHVRLRQAVPSLSDWPGRTAVSSRCCTAAAAEVLELGLSAGV
jgi:hypothetical protein